MINQYSNIFNQLSSIEVIKILEKIKNHKERTDDYWPRWMNLFKRDFPNLPCPAPTIPATTTSSQDINTFKANYYENLYREAEIESYKEKYKLIRWIDIRLDRRLYISENDDINLYDLSVSSPLKQPIEPKRMSTIRSSFATLLAKLAALKGKESPLNMAIKEKNMDVIKLLLEAGADATAADENNLPPILYALSSPMIDINIVCILLEEMHKKSALNTQYKAMTAAEMILTHSNLVLIKHIVAKYNQIDFRVFSRALPLAILEHRMENVVYLLHELKFDPNIQNTELPPALILYLLLRNRPVNNNGYVGRAGYDPNDMTILHALADAGANFDIVCPDTSATLLMLTASQGDLPAVKFLLDNGANVHHKNKEGNTAYGLTQDEEIKTLLLEKMMPGAKKAKHN
ncbi:MAG: hypothetical protein ACHQAX_02835 [Gammaproteobacteria bacterium]